MRAPRIWQPGEGEVLKLGPPASAQVVITVDPARDSSPFAMGTLGFSPSGRLAAHRHLERELVLLVHKGQGRASVAGQSKTVLPGMVVTVPRGAWLELRNTGTGVFQLMWVSAPPGLEAYYRELARSPDRAAAQDIAARHGVELQAAAAGPMADVRMAQASSAAAPAKQEAAPGAQSPRGKRRRRRGRGRGRPQGLQAAAPLSTAPAPQQQAKPPQPAHPSKARPQKPAKQASTPQPDRAQRRRRPYGRIKEVYMEGRWVRITGEGPVIST